MSMTRERIGEADVQLHLFLNPAVYGGKRSNLSTDHCTRWKESWYLLEAWWAPYGPSGRFGEE